MHKAPDAFRTISEAAELLDTPAHVLRFWESKFAQLKPVKRAGGRRYYRRSDIDLLAGIKLLLHEQGMTIRGVQKLLQEKGRQHVASLAPITTPELVEIETGAETEAHESESGPTAPAASADEVSPEAPAQPPKTLQPDTLDGPPAAPVTSGDPSKDAPKDDDADAPPDLASAPQPSPTPDALPPAAAIPAQPRPTRLAHLIRTQPLAQPDRAKLAPLAERLTALLAQMAQRAARDAQD